MQESRLTNTASSRLRLNFLNLVFFDIIYLCQGVSGTYVQYKDDEFRRKAKEKREKTATTHAYDDAGYLRKDKKNGKMCVAEKNLWINRSATARPKGPMQRQGMN